jgi:RNA polymerase sigma-70 factor (ECF subfamily)
MALFLQRNNSAIIEFQQKYARFLRSIAYNILKNNEDAEEVVNDTLMKLWESIPPNQPDNLAAYAGKIARNNALNRVKKNKMTTTVFEELEECIADNSEVESIVDNAKITEVINKFLEKTHKNERIVFVRRYYGGENIEDIAAYTGYSESKVKSMLFRLRKKLKAELETEGLM